MADKDSKQDNNFAQPTDSNNPAVPDFSLESEDDTFRLSVKGAVREGSTTKFEFDLQPSMHTAQFEKDALLKEQLESVDFYIEQGFLEVAFTTLERLELFFPNHPLISERLDKMANMELKGGPDETSKPEPPKAVETNRPITQPAQSVQNIDLDFRVPSTGELPTLTEDSDIGMELPEIKLEPIEPPIGLESESTTNVEPMVEVSTSTAEVPELEPIEKEIPEKSLEEIISEQTGWEVTRKLPSIPAYLSEPEEIEEIDESLYKTVTDSDDVSETYYQNLRDNAQQSTALNADQYTPAIPNQTSPVNPQNDLLDLLDEIGEGDAEDNETAEAEFSIHYNVGLSYFEIELYDDAVEEFQLAYRALQTTGDHPKAYQCCMMLGRCFRIKSMSRPALIWFRRALEAPGHQQIEYCEARYELALVHEDLNEFPRALELYQEIVNVASDYRDARERIVGLKNR